MNHQPTFNHLLETQASLSLVFQTLFAQFHACKGLELSKKYESLERTAQQLNKVKV